MSDVTNEYFKKVCKSSPKEIFDFMRSFYRPSLGSGEVVYEFPFKILVTSNRYRIKTSLVTHTPEYVYDDMVDWIESKGYDRFHDRRMQFSRADKSLSSIRFEFSSLEKGDSVFISASDLSKGNNLSKYEGYIATGSYSLADISHTHYGYVADLMAGYFSSRRIELSRESSVVKKLVKGLTYQFSRGELSFKEEINLLEMDAYRSTLR